MFKKMRNLLTMLLVAMMVCVTPLTAYAEDITVDYIFEPKTGNVSCWSSANGWLMAPYRDEKAELNNIIFQLNDDSYFMNITDDSISRTEGGGIICYGTLYSFDDLSCYGTIAVEWYSMESIDFPNVYILYGDQYVTDETTMATSDYTYHGQAKIN